MIRWKRSVTCLVVNNIDVYIYICIYIYIIQMYFRPIHIVVDFINESWAKKLGDTTNQTSEA